MWLKISGLFVHFVLSLGYFFKVIEFCADIWNTRYEKKSMNIFPSSALIYKRLKFKINIRSEYRYKVHCQKLLLLNILML